MAILRNIRTKTIYLERRWRDWFTQVVSCLLLKKPLPVSAPISKNGCKPHPRSTILSQNIPCNATSIHTIPNSAKLEILRSFLKLFCRPAVCTFSNFRFTMLTLPQKYNRETYHTNTTLLAIFSLSLITSVRTTQCTLCNLCSIFFRATKQAQTYLI